MTNARDTVLFVSHEVTRTGAVHSLLRLIESYADYPNVEVRTLCLEGGPRLEDFESLCPVAVVKKCNDATICALLEGVDVIFVNSVASSKLLTRLKRLNTPILLYVHELAHEINLLSKSDQEAMASVPDKYIACSEAVAANLTRQLGIDPEAITTIGELVSVNDITALSQCPNEGADIREKLNVSPDTTLIGAMGTPSWRKGIDLFMSSAATCVHEYGMEANHFVWIGGGESPDQRKQIEFDIDRLGLRDHLTITGMIANPFPWLSSLDVFCLTSREDPYPLAMIEAAILGVPVTGFAGSGGFEEFARDFGGLVTKPERGNGLAESIATLISYPERGKRTAVDLHSLDCSVLAPRFHALISEALRARPIKTNPLTDEVGKSLNIESYSLQTRLLSNGSRVYEGVSQCQDGKSTTISIEAPATRLSRARIRLNFGDGPAIVNLHAAEGRLASGENALIPLEGRTSCSSSVVSTAGKYLLTGHKSHIYLNLPDLDVRRIAITLTIERSNWFLEDADGAAS